ncbi:hypothetical protein FRC12_001475 [Ceratobasidium sp. 428]|nr:hypothetical protein FRC12_001475 [Ceratobasidium sp. 428]
MQAAQPQRAVAVPITDECYFAICPDPGRCATGLDDNDGTGPYFQVKFGDGNWMAGGRYNTHGAIVLHVFNWDTKRS